MHSEQITGDTNEQGIAECLLAVGSLFDLLPSLLECELAGALNLPSAEVIEQAYAATHPLVRDGCDRRSNQLAATARDGVKLLLDAKGQDRTDLVAAAELLRLEIAERTHAILNLLQVGAD